MATKNVVLDAPLMFGKEGLSFHLLDDEPILSVSWKEKGKRNPAEMLVRQDMYLSAMVEGQEVVLKVSLPRWADIVKILDMEKAAAKRYNGRFSMKTLTFTLGLKGVDVQ
jgi:hypothetical protein